MNKKEKTKQISIYLNNQGLERLEYLTKHYNVSRSSAIRIAINDKYRQLKKEE